MSTDAPTLYLPAITFSDDAVDACARILSAVIDYTVDLTIPENTGYPCERVVIVRIDDDYDVEVAETDDSGARIPNGGTWAVPLNLIKSLTVL